MIIVLYTETLNNSQKTQNTTQIKEKVRSGVVNINSTFVELIGQIYSFRSKYVFRIQKNVTALACNQHNIR